ncbi:hypothetical protein [Planktothrix pseudagardhii]|uniref:Diguanylate cyclase n=1 Tax=Planktothrix pseudagardhii TaxID=132604 RepID=A0A9W4CPB2_9CYAN|nr:hypothetical protein [Planktothrix pseudagardhii]CAD5966950.1 Putative Diguanylate cyclase [Planktothrix pseudagardhii]
MSLDISTMSVMVSAASILQSITLIFFFFLAKQYQGIGIYAIGTVLSAIGFLIFPIRPLFINQETILLNLRFLGNSLIVFSQILYTIGIIKFLNQKINSFKLFIKPSKMVEIRLLKLKKFRLKILALELKLL